MADAVSVGLIPSLLNAAAAIANTVDSSKRHALLIDFQKQIIDAFTTIAELRLENSRLQSDKAQLEQECVRLKDWTADKANYTLRQIASGVFAQVKNGAVGDLQGAHKLCCNCFDKSIKSTLQQSREDERMIGLVCPNGCPKMVFTHYIG